MHLISLCADYCRLCARVCVLYVWLSLSANVEKIRTFLCIEKGQTLLCRHFGSLRFRQSDVIFLKVIYDTVRTECPFVFIHLHHPRYATLQSLNSNHTFTQDTNKILFYFYVTKCY